MGKQNKTFFLCSDGVADKLKSECKAFCQGKPHLHLSEVLSLLHSREIYKLQPFYVDRCS